MLNSSLIMTSHGIYGHGILNKLNLVSSIYVGHALHGGFDPEKVENFSLYEEVWLFSEYEKKIYRDEMKYSGDNLQELGFLRVDYLINNKNKYYELRKRNKINKKAVLIAPTDDRNNIEYKNSKFYIYNENFLSHCRVCLKNSIVFLLLSYI